MYIQKLTEQEITERMNSDAKIAGIVVDGRTAFEYKKKTFIVGGMSVSWGVIEEGENVLKGLSKPSGLYADADFCNACRTIWQREHERLTEANRANGLNMAGEPIKNIKNKGELVMKHKDFKGYLNDAKEIYDKARVEYERLQKEWNETQEEYKRIQSEGLTERGNAIVRGQFMQYEDEYKQGMANLQQSVKTQLAEVRKAMKEHTDDFYRADPNKLDANTLKLLESGIMSSSELLYLANKNRSNVTMIKLIQKYAGEKLTDERAKGVHNDETVYLCHGIGTLDGTEEMKVFDFLADRITKGISTDKAWANANNIIFNEKFDSYTSGFDGMFARPEVAAE